MKRALSSTDRYALSEGGRGEPKQVGRLTPCAPLCPGIGRRARSDAPYPPSLRHYTDREFLVANGDGFIQRSMSRTLWSRLINRTCIMLRISPPRIGVWCSPPVSSIPI